MPKQSVPLCGVLLPLLLLAFLTSSGARAETTLDTRGLAVYTETARDIYIGGLLLPSYSGLDNLLLSTGPKAMEFRIATRRISARGFSGMLLLQAELGSGLHAPDAAISALTEVKKNIKGTLVKGDQFVIGLSEAGNTSFVLNDIELLNIQGGAVFNFFFAGWVGESSSALLRGKLLAGALDPETLTRFEGLRPKSERVVLVSTWMTPVPAPEPKPKIEPKTEPKTEPEPVPALPAEAVATSVAPITVTTPADAAIAGPAVPAAAVAATATATAVKATELAAKEVEATPVEAAVEVEVAQTAQTQAATEVTASVDEAVMDDREYKQQLSEYTNGVMTKVFGQVKYPRRAVKKRREGKVELLLSLDADGQLLEITLEHSSGRDSLDGAAEKAIRKAAPFPKLTQAVREEFVSEDGNSYVMPIPITFRLQD
jgi:protein TonB